MVAQRIETEDGMRVIPGDPNYPAGVSARDIDEHFGSPDTRCEECGVRIEEDETLCGECRKQKEE